MDLRTLSDEKLDQSCLACVKKENAALKDVLLHLAEVDRRKLYLRMALPNLFSYVTKHLGYANGSAQRRIDAAKLSREVPSLIADLENGDIHMSQVVSLQQGIRQANSLPGNKNKISQEFKNNLVTELKNKTDHETQVIVAKALNIQIKEAPKVSHQANESVRLEMTLSKEQWEKIQEMRRLLSNSLPGGSWDQVLEYVADKVIAQKTRVPQTRVPKSEATDLSEMKMAETNEGGWKEEQCGEDEGDRQSKNQNKGNNKAAQAVTKVSMNSLKRMVLHRDGCCQYEDKKAGKKCGSRWNLEVDHIQPLWAGGENVLNNLRVLCANHNKEIYRQQSNTRRI